MPKIPGVNHLRAIKAFEKAGFRIVRQGRHVVMTDGTHFRHDPAAQSRECDHHGWNRERRGANDPAIQGASLSERVDDVIRRLAREPNFTAGVTEPCKCDQGSRARDLANRAPRRSATATPPAQQPARSPHDENQYRNRENRQRHKIANGIGKNVIRVSRIETVEAFKRGWQRG